MSLALKRRPAVLVTLAFVSAACSNTASSNTAPTLVGQTVPPKLVVTSTLDGLTHLPQRIHWQVTPSLPASQISEVDYFIDGHLAWVEHNAPYFYGDDGNWLVSSFLRPGSHVFAVRVTTVGGQSTTETVRASVASAPAPPVALAHTWTRIVTPSDVKRATSDQPPPQGRWDLRIDRLGWQMKDPTPGASWGLFDVIYVSAGRIQMRPTIEYPPVGNSNTGGFCDDTDPLLLWSYSVTDGGGSLTLHPAGHDPCGDRVAILAGTWRRVGG